MRFVNPSDYRVAEEACGACHSTIIKKAKRSIMATGAMLWGGASYNNGIVPFKRYILGEAYTREGLPAAIQAKFKVTREQSDMGVMQMALPLPAWETVPPADIFRIFERGGRNVNSFFPETGIPNSEEEPGKTDVRASFRGPGTGNRVSIPVLNITRRGSTIRICGSWARRISSATSPAQAVRAATSSMQTIVSGTARVRTRSMATRGRPRRKIR